MQDQAQEKEPQLLVTQKGGAMIVEITNRKILDEISITKLGEELGQLARQDQGAKMIINFANVAHMSSSALGMLITLHKRICERKGQLRLCNIQPSIYEVFVITRLNEIFHIHQSLPEALESLN
jgi:anti-sigma B factor antagonist